MKKLTLRNYRLKKLYDYISVIILIGVLIFLWQLYRGPISIPFLKPYIIKALNHDDASYQVTLDSVNLELVRSIKPIRIIANNVDYKNKDGSFTIRAKKTALSFSMKAMLSGVIAPSSIDIIKPKVYIFTSYGINKEAQEEFNKKKIEFYFDNLEEFLERFNSPDKSYAESYINEINVSGAEVEFHEIDFGRKWIFSDLNYHFERNLTNFETELNALVKFKDKISSFGIDASYRFADSMLALQLYVNDVVPNDILSSINEDGLSQKDWDINVPVNAKVDLLIDVKEVVKNQDNIAANLEDAVKKVGFSLEGGEGSIVIQENHDNIYNLKSFMINGEIDTALNKINIKDADFDLNGQKTKISFEVEGLKKYFTDNSLADLKLKLIAKIPSLNFTELYRYWPKFVAPLAWEWCRDSVLSGLAKDAIFSFDFAYDKKTKSLAFKELDGFTRIEDATLDYLSGMPKISNIYGSVEFNNTSLRVNVDKGTSENVIVNGGYVRLYDLNKEDNFADIDLYAQGEVKDILRLIDNEPLGYTSDMGLNPDKFKGIADANLKLDFELKQNLKPEEVKVEVNASVKDFELVDAIEGKPVTSNNLSLKVNNEGMLVKGDAIYEKIPLNLEWTESFTSHDYDSKYKISFKFDDVVKKKLNIDFSVLYPPYIDGYANVDAIITTYKNGKIIADVTGDLKTADVDFSFLGLLKPLGEEGVVKASLEFENKKLKRLPMFSFSKPDFSLKGKVAMDKNDKVKVIDIMEIKGPRTSAKAKIEFANTPKQKTKINVSGNDYDLSVFFNKKEKKLKETSKDKEKIKDDDVDDLEKVDDTDIFIAVNTLWTNDEVAIKNFAGSAKLFNGVGIQEMHMIGNFDYNKNANLKLDYVPKPNKEFLLNIESNDAGSTLKFLRLYDNMRGGILSISAKRNKDKNMIGHAKIRDFSLHNTGVLTKLLSVASVSGMVNMITGEGMTFSHLDAPFEYKKKELSTTEAKAFGNVMGITANGSYNLITEDIKLKGVIAPAYGLNTMIGKIPLIGSLLSGKDGTVFAANYGIKGNVDDPKISINPLSALSPSSLKDLFSSMFGDDDERKKN